MDYQPVDLAGGMGKQGEDEEDPGWRSLDVEVFFSAMSISPDGIFPNIGIGTAIMTEAASFQSIWQPDNGLD